MTAEDQKVIDRLNAKNKLENYVYSVRNSMDSELKEKLSEEDATTINGIVTESIEWLRDDTRSQEDYENKYNETEGKIKPIFQRMYQGGQGTQGTQQTSEQSSPQTAEVDEVD